MLPKTIHKPNFFILGAAKSGTTSLYYHLKQHPDIFLTAIKEPTFFTNGFQVVKNPLKYYSLYDDVKQEKIIGEASHAYLTNPPTVSVLKALFPEAKFVVILRNPADRAYSLYHHMRRWGYEHLDSFAKALEVEELRYYSPQFKKNCPQYFYNFLYFRSSLYGEQLQRYFNFFTPEQFHILTFEQFIINPQSELKKIWHFLGVDPYFTATTESHNTGKVTAKLPWLQYTIKNKINRPQVLKNFLKSKDIQNILQKYNMIPIPPLEKAIRQQLLQKYQVDLQLLWELTGISFSN